MSKLARHIRNLILHYQQWRCTHTERTRIRRPDGVAIGWYCGRCHWFWDEGE